MSKKPSTLPITGLSQLSLVEHALCPLDSRGLLDSPLVHETSYRYSDEDGQRLSAGVRVTCARGLSSTDEFYLWGLLALTFAQPSPSPDFYATPHYCLRELGVIDSASKGGKSYRLFRESLGRLAGVRYENDRFFDPARKEHRQVAFGLLGYNLPFDPDSDRAWRIVWDVQFFEFCQATGGRLRFDFEQYRRFDGASRRLMLLLQKVFYRRRESPRFDLRELAVDVLGFSAALPPNKLKRKVARAAAVLREAGLTSGEPTLERRGRTWSVRFARGPRLAQTPRAFEPIASPLLDPLLRIGLDPADAQRLIRRYKHGQIRLWSDVTLAAVESRGAGFFRKSPAAYLIDNLKAASRGERTPPDWFLATRKREERGETSGAAPPTPRPRSSLTRAIDSSQDGARVVRSLLDNASARAAKSVDTPVRD